MLLLLALLEAPRSDGRIPVWFALATWNPSEQSAERWLSDQLTTTYGTPTLAAKDLVHAGRILPILDGLDEIAEAHRATAMAYLRTLGDTPLVLTCRTGEYIEAVADRVMGAAAVVEVVPIDPATAGAYLTRSSTAAVVRWEPVIAALNAAAPTPCQQALRNPLMLSLARTVYQAPASQPAELTTYHTAAQVEDRLLDGLILSVYGRDPSDISPQDARRWLSFFADHLPILGPGGIGWWHLPRCLPRWRLRTAAGLLYGLIGLPVGLFAWAMFAIVYAAFSSGEIVAELREDLSMAPIYTIVFGLVCGLTGAFTRTDGLTPARWVKPRRRNVIHGLAVASKAALVYASLGALVIVLFYVFTFMMTSGEGSIIPAGVGVSELLQDYLWGGLIELSIFGVGVGLAAGLTAAFSQQQLQTVTPMSAFTGDIRAGVASGLLAALVVELVGMLLVGWPFEGSSGGVVEVNYMVPYGVPLAIGAFVWFAPRRCSSWPYLVTVFLLARGDVIPTRPLKFLEQAYHRGVLRQAGMIYEFRHARLAERLRSMS